MGQKQTGWRLAGELPRIGIRPTIDGRYGGVREGLEAQTMGMARRTAAFLQENLRHASGEAVECVIAPGCIGGVAEAAACAALFAGRNVGLSITVTPCWCYGTETMEADPLRPTAIWGFNGTERPGAVYLAATLAGHNQAGRPAFSLYSQDVQDAGAEDIPPDIATKFLRFARAGLAAATFKGTSYLAMGGVSMGIAGSRIDTRLFEQYLGMRVESVDMIEFVRRMEEGIYDPDEFTRALTWVRANCREGEDPNAPEKQRSREQKDADWECCVKMALIARDLMVGNPRLAELGYHEEARGHNALAGGFQGQRQWTDHLPNGDFLEAILTSSFDWDGVRQPYQVATENDSLNGICMLWGQLLTGTAQLFADVRTYWSPEAVFRVTGYTPEGPAAGGFLHLINSGPAALDWTGAQRQARPSSLLQADGEATVEPEAALKPFWNITPEETAACLRETRWCPADLGYFRGGGFSTDFLTPGGLPVTMFRVNLTGPLGPTLQLAEGYTIDLPEEVHDALDRRTNPTWPTTWFVPRLTGSGPFSDVYNVMSHWGANHGTISYGHIGADLLTLAAMLRIPVDMHNVPADQIFRPSMWDRFGSLEPQGADYRACAALGPLYA